MKKIFCLGAILFSTVFCLSANAEVVGIVDFDKVVDSYSRVQAVTDEISDKQAEIQKYMLDKEREYKKLSTPVERKNFEEVTAKELARRQEAFLRVKERKEAEIDTAIKNAIKSTAIANKIDTVVDSSVVFFGGIDITDKVVKALNSPGVAK